MKIEHNHEHHEKATGNLIFVFILNITFNVIVILGGLITNSVAILADCLHDLSDTISIGLAGVLEHVSQKNPNENYTYGYQRFSILGAVITSIFVIIVSVVVVYESISRLLCPVAPEAGWMLLVAIVGIIFKGVSVFKILYSYPKFESAWIASEKISGTRRITVVKPQKYSWPFVFSR